MSFNKHRHAEYTSQSRHHFQNSISKFGGSAVRDDYFAYSEQETESEIDDFRSVRCHERNYDKELYNSRSKHDYHHYKEYSPKRSSRVYQHPRKGSCEEYHISQRSLHTTSRKSHTSKRSSNYRCHPHSRDHYKSQDSSSEYEDYYNRTSSRTTDRNDSRSRTGSHKQRTPQHPDRSSRYDDRQWSQYSPASLRQSYRHTKRRPRTPSLSPSQHPSRNYQSLRNHSSNGHSRSSTGRRHQERRKFHSRHEDHVYSSTNRSRRHYSPSSSSCSSEDSYSSSSSSGSNCSSVNSYYSSDDDSPSDRHYASTGHHIVRGHYHEECPPERHYYPRHQQRKSQLLRNPSSKRVSDLNDDYLSLCDSEDQYKTEEKTTRRLKAAQNTLVTFQQEFLRRLDNITCMAELILSKSQTPPRTGFRNQPLNWRGLFL